MTGVRRLLQHSLIAAGVSVLTAGAVVGSLLPGPLHSDSLAVAAPLIASAEPTATESSSVPSAIVAALSGREARVARDAQRAALSERQAADARQQALRAQQRATAARAAELEKQAEAKKKAAAAKKAAAKKKAAQARAKAAAAKKAAAAAERKAELREKEAAAKAQGYESGSSPKEIARQMMKSKYGWGSEQFTCYNNIIMRESVWKVTADNPTSSAYGIPQALPGSKMASAGPDWRTNPATQIKWGLGYVKERYGTPCAAWSFKSSHDWY